MTILVANPLLFNADLKDPSRETTILSPYSKDE